MTVHHRLAVLAAALAVVVAGCDNKCPSEGTKVAATPASCSVLLPNADITVTLPLCTTCNQSVPECVVVPPSGDTTYQLDVTAQACSDVSSCPLPPSCPNPPPRATCTFHTPASGSFDFLIINPDGTSLPRVNFTVAAGGATNCSG